MAKRSNEFPGRNGKKREKPSNIRPTARHREGDRRGELIALTGEAVDSRRLLEAPRADVERAVTAAVAIVLTSGVDSHEDAKQRSADQAGSPEANAETAGQLSVAESEKPGAAVVAEPDGELGEKVVVGAVQFEASSDGEGDKTREIVIEKPAVVEDAVGGINQAAVDSPDSDAAVAAPVQENAAPSESVIERAKSNEELIESAPAAVDAESVASAVEASAPEGNATVDEEAVRALAESAVEVSVPHEEPIGSAVEVVEMAISPEVTDLVKNKMAALLAASEIIIAAHDRAATRKDIRVEKADSQIATFEQIAALVVSALHNKPDAPLEDLAPHISALVAAAQTSSGGEAENMQPVRVIQSEEHGLAVVVPDAVKIGDRAFNGVIEAALPGQKLHSKISTSGEVRSGFSGISVSLIGNAIPTSAMQVMNTSEWQGINRYPASVITDENGVIRFGMFHSYEFSPRSEPVVALSLYTAGLDLETGKINAKTT